MSDLSELVIAVKQKQAVQSIQKVQKSLDKTAEKAQNVGKVFLAGWSFTKVLSFFNTCSLSLARINATAKQFNVIFNDAIDTANKGVKNLVDSFSQTEANAKRIMAAMGSRISDLGFSSNMTADMASKLAALGQNAAAAFGKPFNDQMQKKIANALNGQTGGLKDLGIVINTTTQAFEQQVKQIMQAKGYTEQQAKAAAIFAEMMEKGSKYQGAFKSADSLARSFESLKNTFNDIIGSKIGKIFGTLLTPLVDALTFIIKIPLVATIVAWSTALSVIGGLVILIKKSLSAIWGLGWKILGNYLNDHTRYYWRQTKYIKDINDGLSKQIALQKILHGLQSKKSSILFDKSVQNYMNRGNSKQRSENLAKQKYKTMKQLQNISLQSAKQRIALDAPRFAAQIIKSLAYNMATMTTGIGFLDNIVANIFNPIGLALQGVTNNAGNWVQGMAKVNNIFGKAITKLINGMTLFSLATKQAFNAGQKAASEFASKFTSNIVSSVAKNTATESAGRTIGTALSVLLATQFAKVGAILSHAWYYYIAPVFEGIWVVITGLFKGITAIIGFLTSSIGAFVAAGSLIVGYIITGIISFFKTGSWNTYFEKIGTYLLGGFFDNIFNWLYGLDQIKQKIAKKEQLLKDLVKYNDEYNNWINRNNKAVQEQLAIKKKQLLNKKLTNSKDSLDFYNSIINDKTYMDLQSKKRFIEKARSKMKQIQTYQKQIDQIDKSIYERRKGWFDSIRQNANWYYEQQNKIFDNADLSSVDKRRSKISNLQKELNQMYAGLGKGGLFDNVKMPAKDQIAYLKQYYSKYAEVQNLRIEGLKQEFNLAQKFRQFVGGVIQKLLEFKSIGTSALNVNSTQGYKFNLSTVGNTMLPQQFLNQNQTQQKNLQQKMTNIAKDSLNVLTKIKDSITKLQKNDAGINITVLQY